MARLAPGLVWQFVAFLLIASSVPESDPPAFAAGILERDVRTVYYDVEGLTPQELAQSLYDNAPLTDGQRFFGRTEWRISTEYAWASRGNVCSLRDLKVMVDVTITLPRWRPPAHASQDVVDDWRQFIDALTRHEHEHRRLAEEAAGAVQWELAALQARNCRSADRVARERVEAVMLHYQDRNHRYDLRTNHGVHEGAVWPPRPRYGPLVSR